MQIKYFLDQEGGIDPTDPLGDLIIEGNSDDVLVLESTFIDVWLVSFLKVILSIKSDEVSKIEILDEPFYITVKNDNDLLVFTYNGLTVSSNINEAAKAFKLAGKRLIGELSQHVGFDKNLSLKELGIIIAK